MTVSTQGIELRTRSQLLRGAVELLSSMRFAISLLSVICVASVIGTVLKQHEPFGNYVNQFGPFWAELFDAASLYRVYSAWWFLLILAFLVISTSLCVIRNTPKILADLKAFKENIREQSLLAFGHKAQAVMPGTPHQSAEKAAEQLTRLGWKVKLQRRETANGEGWMLAAKIGSANKLGYLAAHSAIVLVCLGGLLDGDLVVRAQMLLGGKTPYTGGGLIADVPAVHRLSERNPTFRGNLLVAEGTQAGTAILNQSDGILLQELPFTIELKKFIVEYYSTGMPKVFASDIVIHDKATGEAIASRVEVNHPASYRGIEIYQSSFDDGGSTVRFKGYPLAPGAAPFDLEGVVGDSSRLSRTVGTKEETLAVEYTGLRVINVENFGAQDPSATDPRAVNLRAALDANLGAANKTRENKHLRNVGPSMSYKLRDAAGQATEFNNYMIPTDMGDGVPVFLLGVRRTPSEPFRYLRLPADDKDEINGFMQLRAALMDASMRKQAAERFAAMAVDGKNPEVTRQLKDSALRTLDMFAGAYPVASTQPGSQPMAGLQAVSDFIESSVPEAERSKAAGAVIRLLNSSLFELAQLAREKAGLPPLPNDARTAAFMTESVKALSDIPLYEAPFILMPSDFKQVQASVFQVARAPGKTVVYLGCALLILGIFAMLYVRERRLWVWFRPEGRTTEAAANQVAVTLALSTNRKTMDGDQEFEHIKKHLLT